MRIALVSTVSAPVRRDSGGSVEALTWLLGRELVKLGHEVTTFGCGGSEVHGEFVQTLSGSYATPNTFDDWYLCEWVNLCAAIQQSGRFDVMHTQAYLWGIPLRPMSKCPLVHTIHIVPDPNVARLWRNDPASIVTAISRHQFSEYPELRPAAIVPHGIEVADFPFQPQSEDYVLYLGRFVSGKGPLQAISAARELGIRLILAGPENPYFREKIKPLVDGKLIQYAGFVTGEQRSRLLGGAKALLYPIQYPESFGLVLIEAMLCGTPVAAMNYGAVPEIVESDVNGFLADKNESFASVVPECFTLDRKNVRGSVEQRFSAEQMARGYEVVYQTAVKDA